MEDARLAGRDIRATAQEGQVGGGGGGARPADLTEANADPAARPGDAEGQTKKKKRDTSARADDRAPAAPVVNRAKPAQAGEEGQGGHAVRL